ncbi:hypothetical protein BDV32DRAFT_117208 [Aspergillus pseudonomiae]|nr:hypothetical protein BDV32DRAFT_117208 [Aspergillus pseudonomiae]
MKIERLQGIHALVLPACTGGVYPSPSYAWPSPLPLGPFVLDIGRSPSGRPSSQSRGIHISVLADQDAVTPRSKFITAIWTKQ